MHTISTTGGEVFHTADDRGEGQQARRVGPLQVVDRQHQ